MSRMTLGASFYYQIHETYPVAFGPTCAIRLLGEEAVPIPLAKCFLKIYPSAKSEQSRAVFTYQHAYGASLAGEESGLATPLSMQIPMVKDDQGHLLNWFEIAIVLLPDIPLHIQVSESALPGSSGIEMQVLLRNNCLEVASVQETQPIVEFLGRWDELDELPQISYQDLGYKYLQGEWLVKSGACLVHSGEDTTRIIRYDESLRQFEFFFISCSGEGALPLVYRRRYESISDIAWQQALNLDMFNLDLSRPDWHQLAKGIEKRCDMSTD